MTRCLQAPTFETRHEGRSVVGVQNASMGISKQDDCSVYLDKTRVFSMELILIFAASTRVSLQLKREESAYHYEIPMFARPQEEGGVSRCATDALNKKSAASRCVIRARRRHIYESMRGC